VSCKFFPAIKIGIGDLKLIAESSGTVRVTYIDKLFPFHWFEKLDAAGHSREGIEIPVMSFFDVSLSALTLITKAKKL
jgi:hypothetical protein